MAKYRNIPTCPSCGKPIAKAKYRNIDNFYGDTFDGWIFKKHICKGILIKKIESILKYMVDIKRK